MPRVTVSVSAPVEATPQAIAERDKGKSKRELAARVRGEIEDPAALAPFPAQWKRVSLSRGAVNLEPGDCELIDEVRRKVLPKLAVRLVKDGTQCTPHQVSMSQPQLEVEALVALPKPDERTREARRNNGSRPSWLLAVGTAAPTSCTARRQAQRCDRAGPHTACRPTRSRCRCSERRRRRDNPAPTSDRRRCADRASAAAGRGTRERRPAARTRPCP